MFYISDYYFKDLTVVEKKQIWARYGKKLWLKNQLTALAVMAPSFPFLVAAFLVFGYEPFRTLLDRAAMHDNLTAVGRFFQSSISYVIAVYQVAGVVFLIMTTITVNIISTQMILFWLSIFTDLDKKGQVNEFFIFHCWTLK